MRGINGQPYLDLDRHFDVDRLSALHEPITRGIATGDVPWGWYGHDKNLLPGLGVRDLMSFQREELAPEVQAHLDSVPTGLGKRWYIMLNSPVKPMAYSICLQGSYSRHVPVSQCSDPTSDAARFPELMEFIAGLPFERVGRIIICVSAPDTFTYPHRDVSVDVSSHRHEFLWFRTNTHKPFYVFDPDTSERHYVRSRMAFFNDMDYHAVDMTDRACFSVRVDGAFRQEFRDEIGIGHLEQYP